MHEPHDHGPSSTFHNDFAQPVPAVHHTRSAGVAVEPERALACASRTCRRTRARRPWDPWSCRSCRRCRRRPSPRSGRRRTARPLLDERMQRRPAGALAADQQIAHDAGASVAHRVDLGRVARMRDDRGASPWMVRAKREVLGAQLLGARNRDGADPQQRGHREQPRRDLRQDDDRRGRLSRRRGRAALRPSAERPPRSPETPTSWRSPWASTNSRPRRVCEPSASITSRAKLNSVGTSQSKLACMARHTSRARSLSPAKDARPDGFPGRCGSMFDRETIARGARVRIGKNVPLSGRPGDLARASPASSRPVGAMTVLEKAAPMLPETLREARELWKSRPWSTAAN